MSTTKKRRYNSLNRKEKAKASRAQILSAATALFVKTGFEKTTINQIAKEAGVAVPTIFATFQSKLGILRAIIDECFPPSAHAALVDKATQEPNPKKRLAYAAKIARQIYESETEQLSLLQSASALSPELKTLEKEREDRRYFRLSQSIEILYTEKALDSSLSKAKALDVFWALTGRDLYRLMVVERGWSPNDYESWLAKTLANSLLKIF